MLPYAPSMADWVRSRAAWMSAAVGDVRGWVNTGSGSNEFSRVALASICATRASMVECAGGGGETDTVAPPPAVPSCGGVPLLR